MPCRVARFRRRPGSWHSLHADSAIAERGDCSYIAVALADDAQGEQWLRQLIVAFDRIIFSRPSLAFALSTPSCLPRYVCRIPYRYAGD